MLMKMHSTLQQWLNELNDEVSIVHSSDINEEANGNLITFGVSDDVLNEWGEDSVIAFIEGCRDLFRSKCGGTGMWFYSWFDEQASQLRISAVSNRNETLPFQCKLCICKLSEMVHGIFFGNTGLFSDKKRLNVWKVDI